LRFCHTSVALPLAFVVMVSVREQVRCNVMRASAMGPPVMFRTLKSREKMNDGAGKQAPSRHVVAGSQV
jgi:hypothetical protein